MGFDAIALSGSNAEEDRHETRYWLGTCLPNIRPQTKFT